MDTSVCMCASECKKKKKELLYLLSVWVCICPDLRASSLLMFYWVLTMVGLTHSLWYGVAWLKESTNTDFALLLCALTELELLSPSFSSLALVKEVDKALDMCKIVWPCASLSRSKDVHYVCFLVCLVWVQVSTFEFTV